MRSKGSHANGKEIEGIARTQLGEIGRDLEAIRFRLLGVEATLPPATVELVPLLEEEEMDTRTEIRAVIQHALKAFIEPAIRDFRNAVTPPETT